MIIVIITIIIRRRRRRGNDDDDNKTDRCKSLFCSGLTAQLTGSFTSTVEENNTRNSHDSAQTQTRLSFYF